MQLQKDSLHMPLNMTEDMGMRKSHSGCHFPETDLFQPARHIPGFSFLRKVRELPKSGKQTFFFSFMYGKAVFRTGCIYQKKYGLFFLPPLRYNQGEERNGE